MYHLSNPYAIWEVRSDTLVVSLFFSLGRYIGAIDLQLNEISCINSNELLIIITTNFIKTCKKSSFICHKNGFFGKHEI